MKKKKKKKKKKKMGYHLTRGSLSRQSQRVKGGGCNLFQFLDILICHFEKKIYIQYYDQRSIAMMLKLTEHVGITIFL